VTSNSSTAVLMTKDTFLRELEKALDLQSGALSSTTQLEEIGWDSFGEIAFLAMVDKKLGVQLPADRVSQCRSVADLLDLVTNSLSV
jgi:acyl carrier protein